MKQHVTFILVLVLYQLNGQANYGIPPQNSLPEKLKDLTVAIEVMHFPKENDPIKIGDSYYWKHATAILCKSNEITITEFGAYLFFNDKWNLRKTYGLKDLDKNFGTKKQVMQQGQPYVWADNWRVEKQLFGGWAMWYFIGRTPNGNTVCGYASINTTSNLLN
ncbi:hypothetical protein [Winogradskyella aurantia]|uniref:Uncharacterized protein n=1 Tax=Winogradskyella aurantia TaxID=1915063 RepID=A0A265UVI7_9FLAO|nr:hypothetical protein [Winogradskyella aurantia]OZV69308.1 hypothetical protein CA834_07585 [Winogradskyella aurantia]